MFLILFIYYLYLIIKRIISMYNKFKQKQLTPAPKCVNDNNFWIGKCMESNAENINCTNKEIYGLIINANHIIK